MKLLDPTEPDIQQPVYSYTVDLDAILFRVRLTWRTRSAGWYMDLYDAADAALLLGKRLAVNQQLLLRHEIDGLPPGEITLIDTEAPDDQAAVEPTFESLGFRHRLYYFNASELPAAAVSEALTITII